MLLSIIGNILGDDDGGSSSSGNDGEGQLAGSISEDELLPGASSGGTGGGGAESDDDIFGDSGGDEEFLDDDSMSLDEMGDVGEMGDAGEMSLDGMDGGDGFDGMDASDDQYSSEIKSRVEEMETEVGSLVSTVNTVQSENEEISESLDDIEENIRKLLEVYEMVTQGVNPFVEDDSMSDFGPGAGTGNFDGHSLFDTEESADADDDIDDDIASAEAEAFLDESIIDEDDGFEDDFDDESDLDGDDDFESDDDFAGDDGASEGDVSFDALKEEFESGDADWDGDDGAGDDLESEAEADDGFGETDAFEDDLETGADDFADELETEADDGFDDADAFEDDLEADATPESLDDASDASQESDVVAPWDDGGRPYLDTVPSEYDTEFLVMDWLDYLVSEAGIDGTARTIEFYQSVAWISEPVGDYLQTLLNGFNGGPDVDELEARSDLGIDHGRSLWWIEQITTPSKAQPAYAEWLTRKLPTEIEGGEVGPADESATGSTPIELEYEEGLSAASVGEEATGITDVDSEPASPAAASSEAIGGGHAGGTVPTGVEAADVSDRTTEQTDVEDAPDDDAGPANGSTADGSQAQKIAIEERDGATDQPDTPGVGAVQSAPTVSTGGVDADGGRMIWVDPDIVLSESGVELRTTRDDQSEADRRDRSHHPELVTSLLGAAEDDQLERLREEYVKPLVDRTDDSALEPWQIDLIQSLLAPDDHADRR